MFIGTYVLMGGPHINGDSNDFDQLGRFALAAFQPGSPHFEPYQIATHMFMHADLGHLFFNMISLYFFGPMVEMVWGHKRFLIYYIVCGLGAYALHMSVQYWDLTQQGIDPLTANIPMLGASGAIFGVMTAFAYLFPNQVISLMFPPISLKAKYFVPIMAGLELFYGVRNYAGGVAHFAHLGGALAGFIMIMIWYKGRFSNL